MKRETLFISDLHLSANRPEMTRRFLHFIDQRTTDVERVFILGDLFDAYIGDDDYSLPNREIKFALKRLSDRGTRVYFQHGNRDFLLGEGFCAETGVTLLGDTAVIDLYDTPALVTHGDLLCTDDLQYQNARSRIRTDAWKRNALSKPLWLRQLYARWYRLKSGLDKHGKSDTIMDVNPKTVAETMARHQVTVLIHGHTHRPALHELTIEGKTCLRIVLPEWDGRETVFSWNADGRYAFQS
jgi:UDP-2,3-diacylglucosamine hydrolase